MDDRPSPCSHSVRTRAMSLRRAQAAVVAGALTLTSIAPIGASAASPGRERRKPASPAVRADDAPDLGGPTDELPDAGGAPDVGDDVAPGPDIPAPIEATPAPVPEAEAEVAAPETPDPDAVPQQSTEAVTPAPSASAVVEAPAATAVERATTEAPAAPAPSPAAPQQAAPQAVQPHRRSRVVRRAGKRRAAASERAARPPMILARANAAPSVAPPPGASAPLAADTPVRVKATAAGSIAPSRTARPGARVHVVAPGESLWSIASDFLGANASSAEVGREVERLWQANRARIGTGDRNLLIAGTVLRLA
jgi:hypothetical protein